MWIGIRLVAGDRSKQVVAIQERRDIELLRRLEGEKGLLVGLFRRFLESTRSGTALADC
jgi:hypothetical protein